MGYLSSHSQTKRLSVVLSQTVFLIHDCNIMFVHKEKEYRIYEKRMNK